MERENFSIEIEGEEVTDLYTDLISLEVELDDDLAGMFRMRVAMMLQPDGTWTYLDDERFAAWKKVTVSAGFESTEELFIGYITHVKPNFDCDPSKCSLDVWGIDGSVLMDREEKLKEWPNQKDSDIASQIFEDPLYGLTPEVENTEVIHDEAVSTILQRETDMQFLKRLALRNGFECYVEGKTGYFRKPQVGATPQPVLAVHFGDETSVRNFSMEVNAVTPANVVMLQVDQTEKEVLKTSAVPSQQKALGGTDATGLLPPGMNPAQIYVGMSAATGSSEMSALSQALYNEGEWFVTAEGEIVGNQYGHVLRNRGTVTIKGIGETYSGVYYVNHVTHSFTLCGYTQFFKVKRNALLTTGSEDFSASSSLLSGLT